jgi:hypothetical protein
MLQIKTIHRRIDESVGFDSEINANLEEGWQLTKRELVASYCMLYAELEREVITEAEKGCENCRYCEQQPESEPCRSCSDDCDKWEAPDA